MASKNWLELPAVKAPLPDDPSKSWTCKISTDYVGGNALVARRTPIFQIWAHLIGELPPIAHIDQVANSNPTTTLSKLTDAVACFRGVKRPYDNEDDGQSILIYILNPSVSIEYRASLTCLARTVVLPDNTVLTIQVRPTSTLQFSEPGIDGIVTRVEFVSSAGDGSPLPMHHEGRYSDLLWTR